MHLHWLQRADSGRLRPPGTPPSRMPLWAASALAAAAVLAPVSALAEPAAGSGVVFVPPTPAQGVPVVGTQHLRAEAVTQGSIRSMRMTVRTADTSLPAFTKQAERTALGGQHEAIDLEWDTTTVGHNGVYRAEVTVETCGDSCGEVRATQDLLVTNPPAVVSGVRAEYRKGIPVVTWQRNIEADLLGYRIYRTDGGPLEPVGHVKAGSLPFFIDSGAPEDVALSYSVIAVREGPFPLGEVACGPFGERCMISHPSPATQVIAVPEVSPPSGGTAPPPDSGGAPATPPQQPAPQPGRTVTVVDPGPTAQPAAPPAEAPPAPAAGGSPPPADSGATAGGNGSRIVRTPPLDASGGAPPPSPETAPQTATAEVTPEAPAATSELELAGPARDETTRAFDRLEAAEHDQTAAVLTVILLGLGALGAYKAKDLLRSGR